MVYEVAVVESVRGWAAVVFLVWVALVFGLVILLLVQRGSRAWFGSLSFRLRSVVAMILLFGFGLGLIKWCVDWVRADQAAHSSDQTQPSVAPESNIPSVQ